MLVEWSNLATQFYPHFVGREPGHGFDDSTASGLWPLLAVVRPAAGRAHLIGENIADYEILDEIGSGGMGVVYRAKHKRLGRLVALKRLPAEQASSSERRRRFLSEARAASALNHPGIVTIHDVLRHEGEDIIVMELVPGESLNKHIPESGLPWRKAAQLALQLSRAMATAHAAGVVHRDLKPANIMVMPRGLKVDLTAAGGDHRIKVLDFGIAKRMTGDPTDEAAEATGASERRLTQETGASPGTPSHMAPEQLLGEPVDPRTDIFSFGLVLYRMITGRHPFAGASASELFDEVLHSNPADLRALKPEVPELLATLVDRSLAKRPSQRPQSMDEVARSLIAVLSPESNQPNHSSPTAGGKSLKTLVAVQISGTKDDAWLVETHLGDTESPEETSRAAPLSSGPTGESAGSSQRPPRHSAALARELASQHHGSPLNKSEGDFWLFDLPLQGLRFALEMHRSLADRKANEGLAVEARIGIHLAQVSQYPTPKILPEADGGEAQKPSTRFDADPSATAIARRLKELAQNGQTLLSGPAFDLARQGLAQGTETRIEDLGTEDPGAALRWLAHGEYYFSQDSFFDSQTFEVFEVGAEDLAPLAPPSSTDWARSRPDEQQILGWRPAPHLSLPNRAHWVLQRKLGAGGFGEVWLAQHHKTHERRVFKFCFEAERLRSLQREITVFRLLKEELGERPDIAQILDWNLQQAPYFIESVYTEAGSLPDWAAGQEGEGQDGETGQEEAADNKLKKLPLEDRLELMAQVAIALGAAHSVGVLHKDIKPANILIAEQPGSELQAILTDFGIGRILDPKRLEERGITRLGLSEETAYLRSSSTAGTRLYMAPELMTGRPPSIQSDVFALGVMLYQVTVADLERPLAPGWERDVDDLLLREDIADCVDGRPENRPRSASEVAERLRSLGTRHRARQAEARALAAAEEAERRAEQEARRAAQRRRIWTATAIVSSFFLIVVSLLAWQAMRARVAAEQGRSQAEQLIDFLLGDLHESLERMGRLDLLEQAARGSQDYFDTLDASQETGEVTLKRGITMLNIGDVLAKQGDTEAARAAFDGAGTLISKAATGQTQSFELFDAKRRSRVKLAWALSRQGDTQSALATVRTVLEETAARAEEDPQDPRWKLSLGECQYWVCAFEDQSGRRLEAVEACRSALENLESQGAPEDLPWRHALLTIRSHTLLGGILRILKKGDAAFEQYQKARQMAERLALHDPGNANWPQRLAWLHFQTGVLRLFHQGDLDGAFADLTAARVAYQELSRLDPRQTRWQDNLAETLNFIARVELARNQNASAIDLLAQAIEVLDRLVTQDPSGRARLGTLARLHQSMGRAQVKTNRTESAIVSFVRAVDLNERLAEAAGDDLDPRNLLSWSHVVLGDGYLADNQPDLARTAWEKAVTLIAPVTAVSDAIQYRDTHAQALLKLKRAERARPWVEGLLADGWRDPQFLELVEKAGLEDLLPSD